LTACTDPTERRFRDDFEGPIPKGPVELEQAFRQSDAYKRLLQDIESYEKVLKETDHADAREFKQSVKESKSKTVSNRSSYTVSFFRQGFACTKREFWLTWGDKTTLYTKFFIIISNGLIVGSLFYGQSTDIEGAFSVSQILPINCKLLACLKSSALLPENSRKSLY
jgi:ATP-binding cassette, subfamily G (WHITE), member 2, SNQ2